MKLLSKKKEYKLKNNETVILFLGEKGAKEIKKSIPDKLDFMYKNIDLKFFKGKESETIFIPLADKPNFIIAGIGKEDKINKELMRNSAGSAALLCREKSIPEINVILPDIEAVDSKDTLESIAEGIYLSNYSFDKYKLKSKDDKKTTIKKAVFFTDLKDSGIILKNIEIISQNTLLCRDLINESSESSDSQAIAFEAKKFTKFQGVTCKLYSKKEIKKMKMGLLLAVNKGSKKPPELVVLKYNGNRKSKKYFAVIGKGVTFDSGGMNLKPTGHLEDMRTDMAGAAVALYVIKTAAELKLKKNLYAVLPLTDNMLSNDSYRPGDIFKAYNGSTVEIGNTDAEGRLILADALSFTEDKLKPECIVDLATLTGACIVALGEIVAAYLTTDDELGRLLENAGESTGDRIWKLPLIAEYEENMKSDIADINNISSDRNAGTIMGAIFLKNFIKKTKWAHIDIAGTSRYSKQRGYRPKNATGFGVRLIVEAVKNWED